MWNRQWTLFYEVPVSRILASIDANQPDVAKQ
ncbi:hypothetical protein OOU_Y34scaffold00139g4 [Pyricularia oryzae Y34]|uniref:Uncharacterized protein n=2 Tax=Pyricularia oryzae TaxID=318829 RepID=A0AA97P7X9_PYRO3|nr:hypothetical protein OOU_Y34scaffold00139g4 [Pyricularia oryzae Y34]